MYARYISTVSLSRSSGVICSLLSILLSYGERFPLIVSRTCVTERSSAFQTNPLLAILARLTRSQDAGTRVRWTLRFVHDTLRVVA